MLNRLPVVRTADFTERLTSLLLTLFILAAAVVITFLGGVVIGLTNYGIVVLGGIAGLILMLLVAIRPQYGVYVIVATIYLNIASILEDNYGIPELNKLLVLLLIVGLFLNRVYLNDTPLIFQSSQGAILLFGFVTILSVIFAKAGPNSAVITGKQAGDPINIILDFAKDFLIILIIIQLANQEGVYKKIAWILIVSAALLSVLTIYQYITGNYSNTFWGLAAIPEQVTEEGDIRAGGPIGDPNFYAMFLLAILPSAIFRVLYESKLPLRIAAAMFVMVIVAAIFLTFSRGGLLTLAILGFIFMYRYRMYPGRIFTIVLVILLITLSVAPATVWNRVSSLGELVGANPDPRQKTEEFGGRYSEALVAISMFYDHPVIGVGKEHYVEHYLTYSSRLGTDNRLEQRQAHSLYLEIAAEQGIIGILAFCVMLMVIFRSAYLAKKLLRKKGREDLTIWVAGFEYGLVAYLITSIFLHGDFERYMWLIIGLVIVSYPLAQALPDQTAQSQREEVVA